MMNTNRLRQLVNRLGTFTKSTYITNLRTINSESSAYDGDGKTTVKILNDEVSSINLVNSYSAHGFRLSNNLYINGSIILFPTAVFSWNMKRGSDITPESLRVFDLIIPRLKILIIGYGQTGEPYDSSIPLKLKSKGYSCEILPTSRAVTTYNYLVHDAVHVAGAFVTHRGNVEMTTKDVVGLHGREELLNEREMIRIGANRVPPGYYKKLEKHLKRDEGKKSFD